MSLLHEIHGLSECCVPGDYLFAQFCKTNDNVLKKNTESNSVTRKLTIKTKLKCTMTACFLILKNIHCSLYATTSRLQIILSLGFLT